jgi:hypothetical protein
MPIIGYFDNDKAQVPFADLKLGKGNFGAVPLPLILSMAEGDEDPHDYAQVTASRIASGLVRKSELLKRHEVFVPWAKQYHAWLGRAAHAMAERKGTELAGGKYFVEVNLLFRHGTGLTIGGRPDSLINPSANGKGVIHLHDYKTSSAYSDKMIRANGLAAEKPDWIRQLNVYRWLVENGDDSPWRGSGLTAGGERHVIAIYRDWSDTDPCQPIEPFSIPLATDSDVQVWMDAAVADYLAARKLVDDQLPPCPPDMLWFNQRAGKVNRCSRYCDVSGLCNQWKLACSLAESSPSGRFTMDILNAAAEQVGKAK